jgi:hypothetical protein
VSLWVRVARPLRYALALHTWWVRCACPALAPQFPFWHCTRFRDLRKTNDHPRRIVLQSGIAAFHSEPPMYLRSLRNTPRLRSALHQRWIHARDGGDFTTDRDATHLFSQACSISDSCRCVPILAQQRLPGASYRLRPHLGLWVSHHHLAAGRLADWHVG